MNHQRDKETPMLQGSQSRGQQDHGARGLHGMKPKRRNREVTLEARARRAYNKIKTAQGKVVVYFASGRLATAAEGSSAFETMASTTKTTRIVGVFDYRVMQRDFFAAVQATARELFSTTKVDGET